ATAGAGIVRRRRVQDELPCFAAVRCLKEAALASVLPKVSHRSHVSALRFRRVHYDPRDGATFLQANVRPRPAAIGGTINTVTPFRGVAIVRFACATPHRSE